MVSTAYFTICARNYLGYARTLGQSLRAAEPGARFFVFLADEDAGTEAAGEDIIALGELEIPQIRSMAFRYTIMELATAIKPTCFLHLFDRLGFVRAVYLDPDIQIFAALTAVHAALDDGASAVLTPHLLQPLADHAAPSDLDILASGTFNLGFAAFAASTESRAFLNWWQGWLVTSGYNDLPRGLFVDQRFADFALSFLPHLTVLRDPGYNVAYWNLAHRPVGRTPAGWQAGGVPLIFFHFSGVEPGNPRIFSKHQNRFSMATSGEAGELVRNYLNLLEANGQTEWSRMPYAFSRFSDGTPIAPVMRRRQGAGAHSFEMPDADWWHGPSETVDQAPGKTITRFMLAIYLSRRDLQTAFALSCADGRRDFHTWFLTNGAEECAATPSAIAAALGRPGGEVARNPQWLPHVSILRPLAAFLPRSFRGKLKAAFWRSAKKAGLTK